MPDPVKPIPDNYRALTPYIVVNHAADAIEYYRKVFGAKERFRMPMPDGRVGHAELEIGDSVLMLADEWPEMSALSPSSLGVRSPVSLLLYVEDCDAVFARAVAEGGEPIRPVQNQLYGDRSGMIKDPYGHLWGIATHVEDVSPEEMERRYREAPTSQGD